MSTLRAAIFDLDGTLVATEEHNQAVWRAFLAQRGHTWDDAELSALVLGRRGIDVFRELGHVFPGEEPEALYAEILAVDERMRQPEPAAPIPGAVDLVRQLAASGVTVALVTSRWRSGAEEILQELGILQHFGLLVTAEDVARGKPHPDGWLFALERLGITADEAIAFEDSVPGVVSATAAGLRTVAVTPAPTAEVITLAQRVVADLTTVDVVSLQSFPH
ncbi:MAG: validoxylamine 7-phosphate phosphatase [Frankiaceae bacterium]|nr:validoxylamine 7-phosphate phosphatase [Frankiaceae bacterium]